MLQRKRWLVSLGACLAVVIATAPLASRALDRWRTAYARRAMIDFLSDPIADDQGWNPGKLQKLIMDREPTPGHESDDPMMRQVARQSMFGVYGPDKQAELLRIAQQESEKWSRLMPGGGGQLGGGSTIVSGSSWVNLGPSSANFESNGGAYYRQVDSGRVSGFAVNPTNPAIVYVATSGGGIWKSYDFPAVGSAALPSWTPITEALPNLAIGALAMDPSNPETLYAGLGDFVDAPGGQIVKTTNGGGTWSAPVTLTNGTDATTALRIRDIRVDPNNANNVLVGSDVGLFRSTNGGQSFTLVDLPNPAHPSGTNLLESIWAVAYAGTSNGASIFVASGVPACDVGLRPPPAGNGTTAGSSNPPPTGCVLGNNGDIWISTNGGQTWSSRRTDSTLPDNAGRITVAAGAPSTNGSTVLYAEVGNEDEYAGPAQIGMWKSTDSGSTWARTGTSLTNPTFSSDCQDINVASQQSWYNQTLVVDPTNANRVLVGGMLCGMRTIDGGNTWQLIAHWLPAGGGGDTSAGTLSYVHADWHATFLAVVGSVVRAFAGTDGGVFWTDSVFTTSDPNAGSVPWNVGNKGIVTHLAYSVASGDSSLAGGDSNVVYTGLQDNGTRFRDPANPTVFNQVIGGDGFGTAAGVNLYWASVDGPQVHAYCVPSSTNSGCNNGDAWNGRDPTPVGGCQSDGQQFVVRYSAVTSTWASNPNTFLTATNRSIARVSGLGSWQTISGCLAGRDGSLAIVRNLHASPNIDGLYGVAMSGGRFAITNGCTTATTSCTWSISNPLGIDLNSDGTITSSEKMSYTSMIAFPPTTPAGKNPGDVFLASTSAPYMQDSVTLVPARLGHLLITQDRGNTWQPFHGNGTGFDLPNVGVNIVRYDPADLSGNTIYAATEVGVYRSTDGGNTWLRFGVGLPLVSVTDLFISNNGGLLRAATYGRGLWEIYPNASAPRGVNGNGDWDRNLQIDFVDLAAMASRLGTTPATAAQPYYDWNDDIVGTAPAIDDSDLNALLGKYGGQP